MKMYIKPLSKEELSKYLAVPNLIRPSQPHAVKLLYQKIKNYIQQTHPQSRVMVYDLNPIVKARANYDDLLIAKDNISRSSTYTHYTDQDHVLRTHTSAHLPGILQELAGRQDWKDVVILVPGLVYRRDVSDKKHVGEIHMLDIWRVVKNDAGRKIVKSDLLKAVKGIAKTAASGWQLRIVDSPHPYTDEGIEVNVVRGTQDIEILECGLIKPKILEGAGLDPKEYSGWALGMGLDRLVMTLKNIPDIRYLRSANPKIAEQMEDLKEYREVSSQPAIKRDLSYCVPANYVEEDISADIRNALAKGHDSLEEVEILSQTPYKELSKKVRERLGIMESQKNVLVRITLRHLERTLKNKEANQIYDDIYTKINHGSGGYI